MNDIVSIQSTDSWQELFASADIGERFTFHSVSRGGKPFLFLPASNTAARRSLDLYPAQSTKARLAKTLLGMCLAVGLRPGLARVSRVISQTDPFAAFLRACSGVDAGEPFSFAVLAGNPSAPGRRHVFLLFDSASQPVAVVKAGLTGKARELIRHERLLLSVFDAKQKGVPRLTNAIETDDWSAFSMDFIAGDSPGDDSSAVLGTIFSSWVNEKSSITVGDTSAWKRLEASLGGGGFPETIASLATCQVRPVLFHGDFAPWNIKVADGRWTVLDWERGEQIGIPMWDWLHHVIQPGVLVRREAADITIARLTELFASADFIQYAKRCQVSGAEWRFTFAYVEYCIRVTRQTEGLPLLERLREALRVKIVRG